MGGRPCFVHQTVKKTPFSSLLFPPAIWYDERGEEKGGEDEWPSGR